MLFSFRTPAASLYDWLAALDKAALREALTEESGLADERDNFDQLLESAKDGTLKHYTVEVFGNQGRSAEQINFMTLHGSKGLEFEAVVILGLEQGAFPSTRDNTEEKLAEVSRLFYVGLTRAKNSISLTYGSNESPLITKIRAATKPKTI